MRYCLSHWLLSYLPCALVQADLLDLSPRQVQSEILAVRQLVEERNRLIKRQIHEIIIVLNSKNIKSLLLKGDFYLMQPVAEIQRFRMISDIDLLIPESSTTKAIETLKNHGYRFMDFLPEGTDYHLDPMIKPNRPCRLEIHFMPLSNVGNASIDAKNAWLKSELITQDNLSYFVFSPKYRIISSICTCSNA